MVAIPAIVTLVTSYLVTFSLGQQAVQQGCSLPENVNGVFRNAKTGQVLLVNDAVPAGSNVTLSCFDGFHHADEGATSSICSNVNGEWYNNFADCIPVCPRPMPVENGHVLDGESTVGSQRQIVCDNGFALFGADVITCNKENQTWTEAGTCGNDLTSNDWMATQFSRVSPGKMGIYRFAAVAADAGVCSEIGTNLMARGGSAVDAAVAAVICDSVINLHFAGIGGGQFMTIWSQSEQKAYTVDGRETAPLSSTEDMYESGNISSTVGPYAIGVPGLLASLGAAHEKFGRLPWKQVIQPSIDLCRNGFPVTQSFESGLAEALTDPSVETSAYQAALAQIKEFMTNPETGKFYTTGDMVKWPKLADTLTRIAMDGANDFYNGSLANDIVADLQEAGSPITLEDLRLYQPVWRRPVEMPLPNTDVKMFSVRPPSSGAILGFMISVLSSYNMTADDLNDPLTFHRFIETLKFAYAKRTYMGDSNFLPQMDQFVANLTSPTFAEQIRALITDAGTHPAAYYAPDLFEQPRTQGTSHISVIDANGNAVSVTSSINTYFGSLVMGKRTGIIFNNEMDDFSTTKQPNSWGLVPSRANAIRPGKRPVSSMCPSIFVKRESTDSATGKDVYAVRLVVGGAGGSKITSGVAVIALRTLFFGQDVKQAVDAFRLHHQLYPETITYERDPGATPKQLLAVLKETYGHVNQTEYTGSFYSHIQAIERVPAADGQVQVRAISDFRQPQGYADGY